MRYSRLISISDFKHPKIISALSRMFEDRNRRLSPDLHPVLDSKQWENALSLIVLEDFHKLNSESSLICIGAGTEDTLFYFAEFAKLIVAIDQYDKETVWSDVAPREFLRDPNSYNPYGETSNLLAISADATDLPLPSNFFDGAFSCGSIEHFGGLDKANEALRELSRVLKIGGIASISTEYRLRGPNDKYSWGEDTFLFSWVDIQEKLLEGTGLELVDELENLEIDQETLLTRKNLPEFLNVVKNSDRVDHVREAYPNLVMLHEGFMFCSVHFALRKVSVPKKFQKQSESFSESVRRVISLDQTRSIEFRSLKSVIIEFSVLTTYSTRSGFLGVIIRMIGKLTTFVIQLGVKFNKIKRKLRKS